MDVYDKVKRPEMEASDSAKGLKAEPDLKKVS